MNTPDVILAIDPGMSGGIAWQPWGGKPAVISMPDTEPDIYEALAAALATGAAVREAYVEDVPIGMPGKGAASSKLNANAGFIRGVLTALRVRIVMVRPAKWQQHFSLGKRSGCVSDSEWKNKLKQCAQRLYPDLKVTLATADALLLLEYTKTARNP